MKNVKVALLGLALTSGCALADTSKIEGLVTAKDVTLDLKIRYVDAFEVMQNSKLGVQMGQELVETNKKWAEEINKRGRELEQELVSYEGKKSTLSADARDKQEKYLAKAKREYQSYVEERQQDFQKEQAKATEKVLKEVKESASLVAKAEKIDVIVDKMTGQVLYNSPKADFSDKIIVSMDKKHAAPKATAVAEAKKPAAAKATA